jgi:mono/diheme cytochrome c family protein
MKGLMLTLLPLLLLAGCERSMRDMYEQPRYDPGAPSPLFPDGQATRQPPAGTVLRALGTQAATSSGRRGDEAATARAEAEAASAAPAPTATLLRRGQQRFGIYCTPCHGLGGDGDGLVVRAGFPHPPSFHEARLREAPDRHFYDVITHGYGAMVSYADRLSPQDRWAVVAFVRALQLSRHAPVAELPPEVQATLRALPAARAASAGGS